MSILNELVSESDQENIKQFIYNLDTEECREAISKVQVGYLFHFPIRFDEETKLRLSTLEGIERQLVDFTGPAGLLYFFIIKDGKLDVDKMAVALTMARFKYVKAYVGAGK